MPDRRGARARTGRRASRSALERLPPAEVARPHLLAELLPAQRRRDRRPRLRPHRVGGRDRLAVPVLAMVDEHAAPLLLEPLGRHEPGVAPPRGRATPARPARTPRVRVAARDRHEHVDSVGAARLHVRAQLEPRRALRERGARRESPARSRSATPAGRGRRRRSPAGRACRRASTRRSCRCSSSAPSRRARPARSRA